MFPNCIFTPGQHWDRLGHFVFRAYQDKQNRQRATHKPGPARCHFVVAVVAFVAVGCIKAPAIYPGRLAGPGHWAGVRRLRSAATSPGAVRSFGWRQSPGVQPPGIGRRVPAWHTQNTAAGHRSAARAKQCRAGSQLPGLILFPHVEGRYPPRGLPRLAASPPNQSSSESNNVGRI
jgi:hypothetical protein